MNIKQWQLLNVAQSIFFILLLLIGLVYDWGKPAFIGILICGVATGIFMRRKMKPN